MKFLIAALLILFVNETNLGDIKSESELLINSYFKIVVKLKYRKFEIPIDLKRKIEQEVRQRFFTNYVFVWNVYDGDNKIATAFLDNVYGKSLPITFLVIINNDGKIIHSEIVRYREEYGNGVTERNWLSQFKGRNSKSSYKLGNDINAISGATISANSITTGIRKVALLYELIKNNL